jgi:hypothetical protein
MFAAWFREQQQQQQKEARNAESQASGTGGQGSGHVNTTNHQNSGIQSQQTHQGRGNTSNGLPEGTLWTLTTPGAPTGLHSRPVPNGGGGGGDVREGVLHSFGLGLVQPDHQNVSSSSSPSNYLSAHSNTSNSSSEMLSRRGAVHLASHSHSHTSGSGGVETVKMAKGPNQALGKGFAHYFLNKPPATALAPTFPPLSPPIEQSQAASASSSSSSLVAPASVLPSSSTSSASVSTFASSLQNVNQLSSVTLQSQIQATPIPSVSVPMAALQSNPNMTTNVTGSAVVPTSPTLPSWQGQPDGSVSRSASASQHVPQIMTTSPTLQSQTQQMQLQQMQQQQQQMNHIQLPAPQQQQQQQQVAPQPIHQTAQQLQPPMQPPSVEWYYLDLNKSIQGPYASSDMRKWFERGYFTQDPANPVLMRQGTTGPFKSIYDHWTVDATFKDRAFSTPSVVTLQQIQIQQQQQQPLYILPDSANVSSQQPSQFQVSALSSFAPISGTPQSSQTQSSLNNQSGPSGSTPSQIHEGVKQEAIALANSLVEAVITGSNGNMSATVLGLSNLVSSRQATAQSHVVKLRENFAALQDMKQKLDIAHADIKGQIEFFNSFAQKSDEIEREARMHDNAERQYRSRLNELNENMKVYAQHMRNLQIQNLAVPDQLVSQMQAIQQEALTLEPALQHISLQARDASARFQKNQQETQIMSQRLSSNQQKVSLFEQNANVVANKLKKDQEEIQIEAVTIATLQSICQRFNAQLQQMQQQTAQRELQQQTAQRELQQQTAQRELQQQAAQRELQQQQQQQTAQRELQQQAAQREQQQLQQAQLQREQEAQWLEQQQKKSSSLQTQPPQNQAASSSSSGNTTSGTANTTVSVDSTKQVTKNNTPSVPVASSSQSQQQLATTTSVPSQSQSQSKASKKAEKAAASAAVAASIATAPAALPVSVVPSTNSTSAPSSATAPSAWGVAPISSRGPIPTIPTGSSSSGLTLAEIQKQEHEESLQRMKEENEAKLAKASVTGPVRPPTVWGTASSSSTSVSAQKERERQAAASAMQQHHQQQQHNAHPQKHGLSLLEIQQQEEEERLRIQRSNASSSQQSNIPRNTRTMAQIVSGGQGVVSGGSSKVWGSGGLKKSSVPQGSVPSTDSDFWESST